MPQIIVVADKSDDAQRRAVMFTERVNSSDFESGHFRTQLAERLGWAVADAHDIEEQGPLPLATGDELPEEPEAVDQSAATEPVQRESRELSAALS
jgi:hypothetical protein